jgi:hypothetical protein
VRRTHFRPQVSCYFSILSAQLKCWQRCVQDARCTMCRLSDFLSATLVVGLSEVTTSSFCMSSPTESTSSSSVTSFSTFRSADFLRSSVREKKVPSRRRGRSSSGALIIIVGHEDVHDSPILLIRVQYSCGGKTSRRHATCFSLFEQAR